MPGPTRPQGLVTSNTLPALETTLTTKNASDRSGYVFAPARGADEVLPLLVALHGQGGDGHEMVAVFKALAVEHRFAVVAPSSDYTEQLHAFTWTVGDRPNDFTTDFHHIAACVAETLARTDIRLDTTHVLVAGYSGGGSSAPYVASNTPSYEAFAVLHGGVFIGGIGPRRVPGWFSAGTMDPIRPAQGVMEHAQSLRAAGFAVTYRSYASTHVVSEQELAELVEWWFALRS